MKRCIFILSIIIIFFNMVITAASTQQVDRKMHAFQKAANYFQKKADLYSRCLHGTCT